MHGFQPIAGVWQGAGDDHAHGVIEVGAFQLRLDRDGGDAAATVGGRRDRRRGVVAQGTNKPVLNLPSAGNRRGRILAGEVNQNPYRVLRLTPPTAGRQTPSRRSTRVAPPDRRVADRRYMEVFGVRLNPQVLRPSRADRRDHFRRAGDGRSYTGLFERRAVGGG